MSLVHGGKEKENPYCQLVRALEDNEEIELSVEY